MIGAPERVGRDGLLRLAFVRRGRRTVLAGCRSVVPLRVMAPLGLDDPACVVSMLNPTGGLVGGDRLDVEVEIARGAHACLTTPSATKVYRTAGPPAIQRARLALGAEAIVEWVPDHTIPFAGAALRQRLDVECGDGARAVIVDAFAAGRVARGEAWRFARLESTLTVSDAAGCVLWDRWVLEGRGWDGLGFTEGRPYFATVALVADAGLDDFCAAATAASDDDAVAAAGRLARRGAVARCTARTAMGLTRVVESLWTAGRGAALGLPPLALRRP